MFPILFEINGVPIYAHGFFLNLALLVCLLVIIGEGRRRRWPKEEIIPITLAAFVGGMIGARVSIMFFNGWETAPVVLDFYRLFDPRIGPGSILGGVAGAYVAGFIASRAIGKAGCAIRGGNGCRRPCNSCRLIRRHWPKSPSPRFWCV